MAPSLRFAIIGAGRIAASHAEALAGVPGTVLTAVVDPRSEAAATLAGPAGARALASHEELLRDHLADAAIVCTPPAAHAPICHDLLEAGVHVVCEKPLCLDPSPTRGLLEAARHHGALLTMASKFRFVEDVVRARELLASGLLGEVALLENSFTARLDMSKRWNSEAAVSGGGVLIDNGTHSVDLARYLLGPIAQVQATASRRLAGLAVEDTVQLLLRTAGGVLGTVTLSWTFDRGLADYVVLHGTLGTLRLGWRESSYRLWSSPEWTVFGRGYDKVAALRSQLANFCAAVRGEARLRVTEEDAVASVEAIEAAYRSMRDGRWTPVGPAGPPSRVHPTAIVEEGVELGANTAVWDNVHIRGPAHIGEQCIIGEKSYIAYGVRLGDRVKINSNVYICNAVTIEDGVMIAAHTVFTNDLFPRATTPDLRELRSSMPDEHTRPTLVREGATIGAACVIGCDLEIGRFAMVGMGSVVTRTVPDHHLVVGSPARSIGCVCRCGHPFLKFRAGEVPPDHLSLPCPECGRRYSLLSGRVTELPAPPA